jgi:phosphoribosylformylglycinamidine (FGAM) synthase-like amidotransferase family enzyme
MNLTYRSPNFDARKDGIIDMLVLHYTDMKSGKEAIDHLCSEASRVSAHYVVEEETLKALNENGQIALRYVDDDGKPSLHGNPNGARENIAGITNKAKNVLGLMPHPERFADAALGGTDGAVMFKSLLSKLAA